MTVESPKGKCALNVCPSLMALVNERMENGERNYILTGALTAFICRKADGCVLEIREAEPKVHNVPVDITSAHTETVA